MKNTFYFTFNTDADKVRNFNIKDAITGLDINEFNTYAGKIIDSGLLNVNNANLTGIKKGELVTQTTQQYV